MSLQIVDEYGYAATLIDEEEEDDFLDYIIKNFFIR